MNILEECLERGDDRIRVAAIKMQHIDRNDIEIDSHLRNVLTMALDFTYIVQVIDDQNRTVFLNATTMNIPTGELAIVSDYVQDLPSGVYTIQVLVWSPLQGITYPLLMEPKTRPLVI